MPKDDLNPRSGKRRIEIPFRYMIKKADPDWDKDRRREPEYQFSGRTFSAERNKRGAYKP